MLSGIPVHERFPDVTSSTDLSFEPFHGDQHINELGYALEQAIFSGKISRSGLTPAISPYGLQIRDFPGLDQASYLGGMCFALGSAKEYGIHYGRRAPIKAIDYLKFFQEAVLGNRCPECWWKGFDGASTRCHQGSGQRGQRRL